MRKTAVGAVMALAFSASAMPQSTPVDLRLYGSSTVIAGIWFTNFENSRFLECAGRTCKRESTPRDWAAIECADRTCAMIDRPARRIRPVRGGGPPDGAFYVRFIGRRGLMPHTSRFLGDGERDVYIERVLEFRKASRLEF